jgi:DNA invertase Pin-like site-specific DNA recombinase
MARVSRKKQNTTSAAKQEAVRLYNVAFYARLSVENNGKDSDSIESQLALLDEYVAARPFLIKVATFIDNGYTGTDFLRPEFTRMMEAVKNGIVDCIMVKDLSVLAETTLKPESSSRKSAR